MEQSSNLPKASELVSGRAGIWQRTSQAPGLKRLHLKNRFLPRPVLGEVILMHSFNKR